MFNYISRYEKKDRRFLLQKVAVALCGPPSTEGNLMDCVQNNDKEELKLQGYEARDEDTVMNVFNKILEQGIYLFHYLLRFGYYQ